MTNCYPLEIEFEFNGQKQTIWPVIIQDESDVILVDCGYPDFLELLRAAAYRHHIQLDTITKLILTHQDMDHVGSAAALKREYPHIEIFAYDVESQYINGTKKSLRLIQAESSLNALTGEEKTHAEHFIHFLKSIEPVDVNRNLHSDEYLPWCGGIQVIHTPGHTPGHISLYLPATKTLIAGDAIVIENEAFNIANPQYCMNLKEAIQSVHKLQNYEISQIICYHGGVFQGDIQNAIQQLIQYYTPNDPAEEKSI